MELTDCQTMAETVRTTLAAFNSDVLALVTKTPTPPPTPVDFQPLYDTLSGTLDDIKAAQAKLTAASPVTAPVAVLAPAGTQVYSVSETATPLPSETAVPTPIVTDGPVLPTS